MPEGSESRYILLGERDGLKAGSEALPSGSRVTLAPKPRTDEASGVAKDAGAAVAAAAADSATPSYLMG